MAPKLKVLLVDDEVDILEILVFAFADAGFETVVASSPSAAIALLQTHVVDVILTDVAMPEGSGLDILAEVRRLGRPTPTFLMSGFVVLTREEAMARGAAGLFQKPFDTDAMIVKVLEACRAAPQAPT